MSLLGRIRRARGLTQTALAINANLDPCQISLAEKGKRLRKSTARKIAFALNVDAEMIFPNFKTWRA